MADPFSPDSINQAIQQNPQVMQDSNEAAPTAIPEKKNHISKGLLGAMLAGSAADALTTNINLSKGNKEDNPLLSQNRVLNPIEIGLSGIASALVAKKLAESGHPTLAKILGLGHTGVSYYDTMYNLNTLGNTPKGGWK